MDSNGYYDHDYDAKVANAIHDIKLIQQNTQKPLSSISPINKPAPKPKLQATKETDTDNQNVKMKIKPLSQKLQERQENEAKKKKIAEEITRKKNNREYSRVFRMKKKQYIEQMEQRLVYLENQNRSLSTEIQALKDFYGHPEAMEIVFYSKDA